MTPLRFKLDGNLGEITLQAFLDAADNWLGVMKDIDVAISHQARGSVDWLVTNLATGSLCVELQPRSRFEGLNTGPDIARQAVRGLAVLEGEGRTPPYLTEQGLAHLKRLVKTVGNHGVTGVSVCYSEDSAAASAKASANIDQLMPSQYSSLGSIEGRLEMISLHAHPRFVVYAKNTNKAVTCTFPNDWIGRIKDALGHRVNVNGTVHWNAKSEPVRIETEDVRVLRDEAALPTIREMAGRYPGMTRGVPAEEHVRKLRYGS